MRSDRRGRRQRLLTGLVLASICLTPAALSWACTPRAQITTSKVTYAPGEAMTITGSQFPESTRIALTVSGGQTTTVTTGADGAFLVSSLVAPTLPGTYTVTAARADGLSEPGLPKVTSFSVQGSYTTPARFDPPAGPGSGANFVTDPTMRCGGRAVTLAGTRGDDVINGTRRRDVIAGLDGDDVIRGLGAGDVLCGGAGRDRLVGGRGDDRLVGGAGRDRLKGGRGRDRLNGGAGTDTCLGDRRSDRFTRCETRRH